MLQVDSFDVDDRRDGDASAGDASTYRAVVLGAAGVGKLSLLRRYASSGEEDGGDNGDSLSSARFHAVAGHVALRKQVETTGGRKVTVEFVVGTEWPEGLRRTHGVLFVFSTVSPSSFDALPSLCATARRQIPVGAPLAFAENMADRMEESQLDTKEVERLAKEYRFRLYRTSATQNFNVDEAFGYLVDKMVDRFPSPADAQTAKEPTETQADGELGGANCPFSVSAGGRLELSANSSIGSSSSTGDGRPLTAGRLKPLAADSSRPPTTVGGKHQIHMDKCATM